MPDHVRIPILLLLALLILVGCQTASTKDETFTVYLHIDGTDRDLRTDASTVRALFDEQDVFLGELDRVDPPLWTPLLEGAQISVLRVYTETEVVAIPFERLTIRDEFLDASETRVLTEGAKGAEEHIYELVYDGPERLERTRIASTVLAEPVNAIHLEGARGLLPMVAFEGTIAYVANGEPWVMSRDTNNKRPLVRGARLDGRVVDLSPDGRYLLYSALADSDSSLNELHVMVTDVLNSRRQRLGIENVLWAEWSPDGTRFAYATVEPSTGTKGWRAVNDLHVVDWPALAPVVDLEPDTSHLMAWFGERWLWHPDGESLAFARPASYGVLDLPTGERSPMGTVEPIDLGDAQVWLPQLSWSSDGALLAAAVWDAAEGMYRLQIHDTGTGRVSTIETTVGRNCYPAFAPDAAEMAFFGVGEQGARLYLATFDGDEIAVRAMRRDLSPQGVPLVWSPDGDAILFETGGDLYHYDLRRGRLQPLTATDLAAYPVWR